MERLVQILDINIIFLQFFDLFRRLLTNELSYKPCLDNYERNKNKNYSNRSNCFWVLDRLNRQTYTNNIDKRINVYYYVMYIFLNNILFYFFSKKSIHYVWNKLYVYFRIITFYPIFVLNILSVWPLHTHNKLKLFTVNCLLVINMQRRHFHIAVKARIYIFPI